MSTHRRDDPEFDDYEPPDADGTTNRGKDGCSGCTDGWVAITDAYVERMVAALPLIPPDVSAEVVAVIEAQRGHKREAYANSVYPCRSCKPALFARWAGGHLDPAHDTGQCSECSGRRRKAKA